jgi:hypothetical protein
MRGNKRPENVIATSSLGEHINGRGRSLEPPEVAELLRHIAAGGTPKTAAELVGCTQKAVRYHVVQQAKIMRITRPK